MRTSLGLWDFLFGKKITIDIPFPDGTIRKVQVTEKWFQKMQRQGKITPMSGLTVKVNVLDPMGGIDLNAMKDSSKLWDAVMEPKEHYQIETWTIGKNISQEQYQRFVDPETQELYVLTNYENGKSSRRLVLRSFWQQGKQMMDNIDGIASQGQNERKMP